MTIVNSNHIETVSGRFVDLINPTVDDIDADDLAWGLSRMPRYAGHTINELLYSVGQHSIFVAETLERVFDKKQDGIRASLLTFIDKQPVDKQEGLRELFQLPKAPSKLLLVGLLHDGSEAYLLDVPTPLKNLPGIKEAYSALEGKFMERIWEKFGLSDIPAAYHDMVRWADGYTLTIEAYHLMRSRGQGWPKLMPVTLKGLQEFKSPYESIKVYEDFLEMLSGLTRT
jgi:uncharacterized protein